MVPEPKQNPSPDWINGRKQGGTVWAREERRRPKTFKLQMIVDRLVLFLAPGQPCIER